MADVVQFRAKTPETKDDEVLCVLEINAEGEISLTLNAWRIETVEQHNWLIAKIVDAASRLISRKNDIIDGDL